MRRQRLKDSLFTSPRKWCSISVLCLLLLHALKRKDDRLLQVLTESCFALRSILVRTAQTSLRTPLVLRAHISLLNYMPFECGCHFYWRRRSNGGFDDQSDRSVPALFRGMCSSAFQGSGIHPHTLTQYRPPSQLNLSSSMSSSAQTLSAFMTTVYVAYQWIELLASFASRKPQSALLLWEASQTLSEDIRCYRSRCLVLNCDLEAICLTFR